MSLHGWNGVRAAFLAAAAFRSASTIGLRVHLTFTTNDAAACAHATSVKQANDSTAVMELFRPFLKTMLTRRRARSNMASTGLLVRIVSLAHLHPNRHGIALSAKLVLKDHGAAKARRFQRHSSVAVPVIFAREHQIPARVNVISARWASSKVYAAAPTRLVKNALQEAMVSKLGALPSNLLAHFVNWASTRVQRGNRIATTVLMATFRTRLVLLSASNVRAAPALWACIAKQTVPVQATANVLVCPH